MKVTVGEGVFVDDLRPGWLGTEPIVIGMYTRKFTVPRNRRVNWKERQIMTMITRVLNRSKLHCTLLCNTGEPCDGPMQSILYLHTISCDPISCGPIVSAVHHLAQSKGANVEIVIGLFCSYITPFNILYASLSIFSFPLPCPTTSLLLSLLLPITRLSPLHPFPLDPCPVPLPLPLSSHTAPVSPKPLILILWIKDKMNMLQSQL